MDRNKKESEKQNKQETLTSSNVSPPAATTKTTPSDNDTSTDSFETFGSWTLVNDKGNIKKSRNDDNGNRLEILQSSNKDDGEDPKIEQEDESKTEEEPQAQNTNSPKHLNNDDFSDGISVISDNEWEPTCNFIVRDLLKFRNYKLPATTATEKQLRQRRKSSTQIDSKINKKIRNSFIDDNESIFRNMLSILVRTFTSFCLFVGPILIGLFFFISLLPSKTSNVSRPPTIAEKMNDLELQNNLMRAEIDLLNKQVKYLSSLNDPQKAQTNRYKDKDYKDRKTFKAWPGNGDTLKPVDITKKDLRQPYKCPDGSFVEIANMCIEQRPADEPSIVDQFGKVVQDLKEKSEAFKTFEQVAEELHGFQESPFEHLQNTLGGQADTEAQVKQFANKNKPIYETPKHDKQNLPYREKHQRHYREDGEDSKFAPKHKHNKYDKPEANNADSNEYKKPFGGAEYKQNKGGHRRNTKQENFHDNSQEQNYFKERKNRKDSSKERYRNDFNESEENSKENKSKERYNKGKYNKEGQQHKEDIGELYKKLKDQAPGQQLNAERNWFMQRAASRENKRSGEKYYR